MRLVVAVNHCSPFFVGGSERVVQQITESMHNDYGMECHVLSTFATSNLVSNGIHVWRISNSADFINQINKLRPDHFHVYSDSFTLWPDILRKSKDIRGSKSIALVGMNQMRSRTDLMSIFRENHKEFSVITHSDDYLDYQTCKGLDIPATVIPNAVDMKEFGPQPEGFKKKYGIRKKMILCVSNFYPGKGQEHLFMMLKNLHASYNDFTIVFICTTVNFQPAAVLRMRLQQNLAKAPFESKLLIDIPRSETLQAFKEADVFAFPSQVEVAPLVLLEAMAAGLPWVALDVGNAKSLDGGYVVAGEKKKEGKWMYSPPMYEKFQSRLYDLLVDDSLRRQVGEQGKQRVLRDFDWEIVKTKYHKIFSGESQ